MLNMCLLGAFTHNFRLLPRAFTRDEDERLGLFLIVTLFPLSSPSPIDIWRDKNGPDSPFFLSRSLSSCVSLIPPKFQPRSQAQCIFRTCFSLFLQRRKLVHYNSRFFNLINQNSKITLVFKICIFQFVTQSVHMFKSVLHKRLAYECIASPLLLPFCSLPIKAIFSFTEFPLVSYYGTVCRRKWSVIITLHTIISHAKGGSAC